MNASTNLTSPPVPRSTFANEPYRPVPPWRGGRPQAGHSSSPSATRGSLHFLRSGRLLDPVSAIAGVAIAGGTVSTLYAAYLRGAHDGTNPDHIVDLREVENHQTENARASASTAGDSGGPRSGRATGLGNACQRHLAPLTEHHHRGP